MVNSEIIELQNSKIKELLNIVLPSSDGFKTEEFTFKAPTGSGKTYMIALFCEEWLKQNRNVVFLVSSLSKAELSVQNKQKFDEYKNKGYFKNINSFLIQSEFAPEERPYINDGYNVYFLPHDLFKENSILYKYGALEHLLKTFKKQGKKIILIKDECHIKTGNIDTKLLKYFSSVINFSATPDIKKGQTPTVELTQEEALKVNLIKDIQPQSESENLEDAIKKFEDVKKQYQDKLNINPCMIIQISNRVKGDDELNEIKSILSKYDLLWVAMFDDSKKSETNTKYPSSEWKVLCKSNTSDIDIIIFKLKITEGWDIPRACMLYQIRDTQSKQLDEQVIGRIRRNPVLENYENLTEDEKNLALKAYVWGALPDTYNYESVKLKKGAKEQIKVKTTRLKNLKKIENYDFENFLKNNTKKDLTFSKDIFSLYKDLQKTSKETRDLIKDAKNYSEWIKWTSVCEKLDKEVNAIEEDYENSIELSEEVSFPSVSSFEKTEKYYSRISNWVWEKKDKNSNKDFYFDSEAEKEFAEFLSDTAKHFDLLINKDGQKELFEDDKSFCYGRNFFQNSNIKFEYYNLGLHSSYPDFIVKDKKGKIHIFEVKSVNNSSSQNFDTDEYENKIFKLKKLYTQASRITGQDFYIPIKIGKGWNIFLFSDGNEEEKITLEDLKKRLLYQ